jgi:hypothetical protein
MIDDQKNPHREHSAFFQRAYWKGDHACGRDDEPDRVELMPKGKSYPAITFALPRQRFEMDKIEALLSEAYHRGRNDNRQELGKLLKDLIAT